ncbi:hypothetical protein [Candidatus Accumulibacter phosphatis]|uniref:Uncharacterized protein n=1 Tax=Candidatus Accumulibacter phosphatis TaxID=327160 RepID=A0A5S4EN51_9PROT|nr:hypothetical protein [Candidatus Accumulibacter phosphatis]TMQ76811.1 hypothetical protein ACCUM_3943 [Candidatus Accumulibacter phosphatis]
MQKILLAELDRTDETVSSDLQPLDEDSTGKEWTEMQEMLSVALDDIEDELFEISSVERTHEEMEKLSKLTGRLVQSFIQRIPGNGIPVERECIAICFLAVGLARRTIEEWKKPQEAVNLVAVAARGVGALKMYKVMPIVATRRAAHARHAKDREKAEAIKAWYRENIAKYRSMDAASLVVSDLLDVSFRTAHKHVSDEAKKLRSARRA